MVLHTHNFARVFLESLYGEHKTAGKAHGHHQEGGDHHADGTDGHAGRLDHVVHRLNEYEIV